MSEGDRRMIVDRIENGIAVLEGEPGSLEGESGSLELPSSWLPAGAREGSVLRLAVERGEDSSRLTFALDDEGQAAREAEIDVLRDSLPTGPEGDITL